VGAVAWTDAAVSALQVTPFSALSSQMQNHTCCCIAAGTHAAALLLTTLQDTKTPLFHQKRLFAQKKLT